MYQRVTRVLMDNFSNEQYERFEAYRRNALPKQAVRRVIQQTLGHQVSAGVAQVLAGIGKVFVGEIIEKGWSEFYCIFAFPGANLILLPYSS